MRERGGWEKARQKKKPLLGPPRLLLSLYLSASLALLLLHRTVIESTDTDTELRHTTHTHSDRKEAEEGERAQGKRKRRGRKKNSPYMMMAVGKSETVKLRRRRRVERHTPSPSSASSSRSSLPWKLWWRESASSKQKLRLLRFPAMLVVVVLLHTLLPLSTVRTIGLNALKEKGGGELRRFPLLRASNKYCCGRTKTLGLFGTFHGSDCLGEAVVGKFQLPLGQCCICYSIKSYMCSINSVGIHIYHRMHGEGKKREERTAVAEERNRQSQNRKTTCALWSRPAMRGRQQ